MNESDDATKQLQSPCVGNLIADSNSSDVMVIVIIVFTNVNSCYIEGIRNAIPRYINFVHQTIYNILWSLAKDSLY